MADIAPAFAAPSATVEPIIDEVEAVAPARSTWREDLRLFVLTWAAGFVFFLIFLA